MSVIFVYFVKIFASCWSRRVYIWDLSQLRNRSISTMSELERDFITCTPIVPQCRCTPLSLNHAPFVMTIDSQQYPQVSTENLSLVADPVILNNNNNTYINLADDIVNKHGMKVLYKDDEQMHNSGSYVLPAQLNVQNNVIVTQHKPDAKWDENGDRVNRRMWRVKRNSGSHSPQKTANDENVSKTQEAIVITGEFKVKTVRFKFCVIDELLFVIIASQLNNSTCKRINVWIKHKCLFIIYSILVF